MFSGESGYHIRNSFQTAPAVIARCMPLPRVEALGEDGILHIPGALVEELYHPTAGDLSDPSVLFALREQ